MMKLSGVRIVNFKSFSDTSQMKLGQVNVLVGRNNHGKSALIRAVHLLQQGAEYDPRNIRLGAESSEIIFELTNTEGTALTSNQAVREGAAMEVIISKHSGPHVGVLGNGGFVQDGVTFSLR
jgi:predicted ATP-dependent endonuclease of OLD family